MGKELKREVFKGQVEFLQMVLAKGQARRMCWMVSGGPLHRGQERVSGVAWGENLKMFDLRGRISQVILQRKCFRRC